MHGTVQLRECSPLNLLRWRQQRTRHLAGHSSKRVSGPAFHLLRASSHSEEIKPNVGSDRAPKGTPAGIPIRAAFPEASSSHTHIPPRRTQPAVAAFPDDVARPLSGSSPRFHPTNIYQESADSTIFSRIASLLPASLSSIAPFLENAACFYPLFLLLGFAAALTHPSVFSSFTSAAPSSYSIALGAIMLAMGLSMEKGDMWEVVSKRPGAVLCGCAAQYLIMPLTGFAVSRLLSLPPPIASGLILLSCCPGGTASNVVTLIARADVALSVLMTTCTTFASVLLTPLLTQLLTSSLVPVDAAGLALSTVQVVLLPVLAGVWLKSSFPAMVSLISPACPLIAVLTSTLLASSVFASNMTLLDPTSIAGALSTAASTSTLSSTLTTHVIVCTAGSILLVHAVGFVLGYFFSSAFGFNESQRRAMSIEVGMQNSSLGVVLAVTHFASPLAPLPAALSAMIMNLMASLLAVVWRGMGEQQDSESNGPSEPTEL